MQIYSVATGKTFDEIEQEFAGQGYGDFKPAVGEAVVETAAPHPGGGGPACWRTRPIWRASTSRVRRRPAMLPRSTLRKVYKKVGFVAR